MAAKTIGNIRIDNAPSPYDAFATLKYDLTDEDAKMIIYKNFVAYVTEGCSTAPLTEYRNNDIYQELTTFDKYFTSKSDEKIYIVLRRSRGYTGELEKLVRNDSNLALTVNLKQASTYILRLFVTTYSQAEWYYATSSQGQTMLLKQYKVLAKKTLG